MHNSYFSHWQDYKRKRNTTLFLLLTYIPAVALFGPLLRSWTGYADAIEAVATIWLAAYVVAALRLAYWRCPRCKEYYFSRRTISANPFLSSCVHCGLPKWALHDAGNSSAGMPDNE